MPCLSGHMAVCSEVPWVAHPFPSPPFAWHLVKVYVVLTSRHVDVEHVSVQLAISAVVVVTGCSQPANAGVTATACSQGCAGVAAT